MSVEKLLVNYLELPLVDHAATQSFYQTVFGWEYQDWGPDYLCFQGAGIDLGFNRELTPASASQGVLVILRTDDLEKTELAIRNAGSKILKEAFEFPGGRRFHFADPNGNELAVWAETK